MRTLFVIIIAATGMGIIISRGGDEAAKERQTPGVAYAQASTQSPPSEHNWPKRSLDRAADVKRQVAEQRQADGTR